MPGDVLYLDASALVKLVIEEAESGALRTFVADWPRRVSSIVADVEVRRAAWRAGGAEAFERAGDVLRGVSLLEVDPAIAAGAAALGPDSLRTLDAIHVASALSLGDEGGRFVTYDARLGEAATTAGLEVAAPA